MGNILFPLIVEGETYSTIQNLGFDDADTKILSVCVFIYAYCVT